MFNKMFGGMIVVPLILVFAYGLITLISGILTGEVNIIVWLGEHKLLLACILTWVIVKYATPLKYFK